MFLEITVIIQIFEKRIPMEKGETSTTTSRSSTKNMTNLTKPNQLLIRSKNEDNTASQSTPNHLTEKKKAEPTMIMFLG